MKKADTQKLKLWQDRLARNEAAYSKEESAMDAREQMYLGMSSITPIVRGERKTKTPHVRNICAELIESQVSSSIPQPKVTARRKKDEALAKLIEDMLRNELDRLPFEQLNDMMERTVPIQGGAGFLIEWDNTERTHFSVGEINVSALHPKQMVPQDGVYTGIEDMDYIIIKMPQTKDYIKRRYGVDVGDESEQEPEVKSGSASPADDLVTQYIAYYRNTSGGIGLYSWVCDTQLEDIEDYQARRLKKCTQCGAAEPLNTPTSEPTGTLPGAGDAMHWTGGELLPAPSGDRSGKKVCPYCGGTKWEESSEDYEELYAPVYRSDGSQIPGAELSEGLDELGLPTIIETPTRIPFYKPDIYPVILQKNVSVYGKFLGDSDIDKIKDQQNTSNRIEAKIIDKLLASGSYITLPPDASIKVDADDMKVIRLDDVRGKSLIDVYDLQGNVEQDLVYLSQIYEEARQTIGITDSFQGRKDTTATSGTAKEFAAAQTAGRLESKRVMKEAAYAALFEAIFKFKLAYADEPRPVMSENLYGNPEYKEFNRYDFLEQDENGEWCWNDMFLFSCDTSTPLASNREAMWQETRQNLQTGAFGDPSQVQTLILFWSKMEMLHYPGAGETKAYLEEQLKSQQQQAQMQEQMQSQMQLRQAQQGMDSGIAGSVIAQAQQDAMADAQASAPTQTDGAVTA